MWLELTGVEMTMGYAAHVLIPVIVLFKLLAKRWFRNQDAEPDGSSNLFMRQPGPANRPNVATQGHVIAADTSMGGEARGQSFQMCEIGPLWV
jgi:hypothetical protein